MTVAQFVAKLRKYEIQIRKAVNGDLRGNFRSIFKGTGLEFNDLREYQYGDDVRTIDWNVSSKGHGTFVRLFKEERDQTVFFVLDVSASQQVGSADRSKLDTAKEICGVLALSAIQEASQVGLLCFSDQKEKYIRPASGMKQGYEIVNGLYKLAPLSTKTDLSRGVIYTLEILKKRSVVILISDFIDVGYEHNLTALARKHDLVILHLHDLLETDLPRLGIIPVYDTESGQTVWMNTSSVAFRERIKERFEQKKEELAQFCKQNRVNYLTINVRQNYVPELIRLFKVRQKR